MKKAILLLLALSAIASVSVAKDLGVLGTIYPIIERDIRQMLLEDATGVDWSKAQGEIKDSAKNYVKNLARRQLPSVEKTQTVWMDPSIQLSSDIQVPVEQPDGSYSWRILAAKGTRVNPLEKTRPASALLFIDGADPGQVEMVKRVLAREPLRYTIVEAGQGNLDEDNKAFKTTTFYASDAMLSRFQVTYLPSLVYPGIGPRELFLGNTSIAAPYRWQEVFAAWPGQAPQVIAGPQTNKK